jgi:mycothiol system anti-sigma-R factor
LNCQEALEMIHPYIDRELDETRTADVEQHLEQCQECNLHAHEQITLHSALRDASFYYRAPAEFKSRIASSLQLETVWARRLRARARRDITVPKGI